MPQSADENLILHIEQLAARLERISADSYWAHQASGVRVALLRCLDKCENVRGLPRSQRKYVYNLVSQGYTILENAAKEIEEPK